MARLTVCTFTASESDGAWAVKRNGVFYGDYHSRAQAVASAQAGARAIESRGGTACVLVGSDRQVVPH